MRIRRWSLGMALTVMVPGALIGQVTASELQAGEQVRYRMTDGSGSIERTTIQRSTPFALMVAAGQPASSLELPWAQIAELDVARGRTDLRWPGAVVGGGLGCAAVGNMMKSQENPGTDFMVGCLVGIPVGSLVGAILGRAAKVTKWIEVDLSGIGPSQAFGFAVDLQFPRGQ